jgi:cell division septation protein DedD
MWNDYYMGICQQRLGRFTDADGSFQRVEADFPNTEPAKRAHLREGLRGFYVQVGAFADADDAAKAAGAVSAAGGIAMKTSSKNLTVIRSGNVPSYAQAVVLRSRLAGQYPDASVVP